jgi:hypothetical protein
MVLQLLAATEKTGQLEVRGEDEEHRGFLAVAGGRLVSAQYEDEDGLLALGAAFAIDRGGFEFLPQDRVERADLEGDLEELLARAVVERERIASIREVIANDRVRFRLSARATERGEITLAPQQWKALLLVDGQRDVITMARELGLPRLTAQQLLATLVRAGLVDAVAPPEGIAPAEEPAQRGYRRLPPMQPIPPTTAGEQVVLRGRLPDFPLETIVQLLAETKKTGRLEVRAGRDSSTLGMSEGRLVSARSGEEEGELGLGAAFTAREGEFDFVPMPEAPAADLGGALDPLLDRAAETRDRIVAIRGLIPNERARFTLSERATRNPEIVLTPEQWRVLLGVNGERDVVGIAEHLRMRRLPTMMVLADLMRGGYVDVIPADEKAWPYVERRRAPWPAAAAAPVVAPPAAEEAAAPEAIAEEVPEPIAEVEEPLAEVEEPLAETPLDRAPEEATDDRLSAIEGVVGQPEPAPPPPLWEPAPVEETSAEAAAAEATAEAFARPPEPEPEPQVDPRLAAFGAPPAEPEPAPSWEQPAPSWERPAPSWERPTPVEEPPADVDPRLAAFGTRAAQPETPTWEAPAAETPAWQAPAAPAWAEPEPEAPPAPPEPEAVAAEPAIEWPERAREVQPPPPPLVEAPARAPERKKGGLFGGLFGGGAKAAPAPAAPAATRAGTRAGQLASFANELVSAYNSGAYGKARVEDRMLSLLMRADEQADPIDRPLPIVNDRLDVSAIDRDGLPERQALPYLAVLVRQIYDDAERAFGKDKARRGFRDVRDRVFGRDLALLQAPEVAGRLPKV